MKDYQTLIADRGRPNLMMSFLGNCSFRPTLICHSFNLNKCKNKNCTRKRVCCIPGCYQSHPQTEHVVVTPVDSSSSSSAPLETNDIGDSTSASFASNVIPFSPEECFCIEVFSGSAGLTAEMRSIFPTSFGIDHKVTRPKSKVISLDLQNEHNQRLLLEWSSRPTCLWIHFGVPCGTASRAREIRMSDTHHGPLPVRSDQHPDGLPSWQLASSALVRLRAANRLHRLTVRIIRNLNPHAVWSVENPSRSYLWQTSYFQQLLQSGEVFRFEYHMCMFGGLRLNQQISLPIAASLLMLFVNAIINIHTCRIQFTTIDLIPHLRRNIPRIFARRWYKSFSLTSTQNLVGSWACNSSLNAHNSLHLLQVPNL